MASLVLKRFFPLFFLANALFAQTFLGNIGVGTNPRAVAVNPVTNTIYVANYGSDSVTAIDGPSGRTTTVMVGTSPAALSVNPLTNKIYVANYGSKNVTVIDGATNSATATVAAGTNPDAIAVNAVTNKIYVANNSTGNLTVIDGATNMASTVTVGSAPVAIAINTVTNKIYVANNGSGNITVIDGATNDTTPVTVGSAPSAVAVNPVTNKIYVANGGSANVTVVDGASLATTPVTAGTTPYSVAVNVETNRIYVANLGGNVTVIDGATNTPSTVSAGTSPYAVAVDPLTNQAFVANNGSTNVTVIDGANGTTTVRAGTNPYALAVNLVSGKIYVANDGTANVTMIDAATASVDQISIDGGVAVDRIANKAYVTSTSLFVIDGTTNSVSTLLASSPGFSPVVNPATNKIYLEFTTGTDLVIDGSTGDTLATLDHVGTPVAVNTATNKIYTLTNTDVIVIDGATNAITTIPAPPMNSAVVDEATNKLYGLGGCSGSECLVILDGVTNGITTIPVSNQLNSLSLDEVADRIYVGGPDGATISIIDAATGLITGNAQDVNYPYGIAADSVNNYVYLVNQNGNNVAVLDTTTNKAKVLASLAVPSHVAFAQGPNRIWIAGGGSESLIAMLDGGGPAAAEFSPADNYPNAPSINPVSGRAYVDQAHHIVIGSADIVQNSALTTTITPVSDSGTQTGYTVFATTNQSPQFTVNATCNYSPATLAPTQLYYQLDTMMGAWQLANAPTSTGANSASFTVAPNSIPWGLHSLYVSARCGEVVGAVALEQFLIIGANGAPGSLTTPAPGSQLSSSSVSFGWSGGVNVTDYVLKIGSTLGGSDIANVDAGTSTSTVVSSLPTNGETIYADLASEIGGNYYHSTATYTAPGAGVAAAITSPTPGSKMTGSTVTFHWNAGSGISSYTLEVGTQPGGDDIAYIKAGTALSAAVSGLPTDGSKFYVYLWSQNGSLSLHNGYTYIASGTGTAATITSPASGAKLSSSIALFDWTAGTGISQYILYVGRKPGADDIAYVNAGSATSASVSDLPTDGGKFYVYLWSLNGATWLYSADTYTAAGSGTAAAITSPAPGSKLTSSTATFNWSAGTGISQYTLAIGTTPGASDIAYVNAGNTTSTTVTTLPTNGSKFYVYLYSLNGSTWLKNTYTYTATGP